MIHGKCKSAGCYAMTDALIEEIYAIARESFLGGNDSFQVHAFPFRMTNENMARYVHHPSYPFWKTLKEGYDYFELTRQVPTVAVCSHRYVVNVALRGGQTRLDPGPHARRSSGRSPILSGPSPVSRWPSSASWCRVPGCAAWPASRRARSALASFRPARSTRDQSQT